MLFDSAVIYMDKKYQHLTFFNHLFHIELLIKKNYLIYLIDY